MNTIDSLGGNPILVIAAGPAAAALAEALRATVRVPVDVASERRTALHSLQHRSFSLVILEESLIEGDLEFSSALYDACGTTLVCEQNFATAGVERIMRQIRAAVMRRALDLARARQEAADALGSELNAALTGLLLESQMALRRAGPELTPNLERVVQLAGDLRDRLRAVPMTVSPSL